jgi:hypothetical protein
MEFRNSWAYAIAFFDLSAAFSSGDLIARAFFKPANLDGFELSALLELAILCRFSEGVDPFSAGRLLSPDCSDEVPAMDKFDIEELISSVSQILNFGSLALMADCASALRDAFS